MIYHDDYKVITSHVKPIEYEIDSNNCWNCTSHRLDKDGYPKIKRYNKTMQMSRYIYTIHNGEIPYRYVVMHKCDNPSCINPQHLMIGTTTDNNRDKVKKGRFNIPRDSMGRFSNKNGGRENEKK